MIRNIPFGKPLIGNAEKEAVLNVLSNTQLVHGEKCKEFENAFSSFIGGGFCTTTSSCTSALHLSYINLGIHGHEMEVIVPALSHVASAHSIEYNGAKPIFVDVDLNTGNIDTNLIEDKINEKTKAICVVHFAGLPVDMEKILILSKKYNLKVIEDCALGIGAKFQKKHVGLFGDYSSFSFYPVKHITTAEGGMLVAKNKTDVEKISKLKAFGYDRNLNNRKVPGLYDVNLLGYNFRMNEIQAAIGTCQLKQIDSFLLKRSLNSKLLRQELQSIGEIMCLSDSYGPFEHSNYCLIIVLKEKIANKRIEIIEDLNKVGIGTSIYYPGPIPYLEYYKNKYNFKK